MAAPGKRIINYAGGDVARVERRPHERWLPWIAPVVFFALTLAMFADVLFLPGDRVVSSQSTDLVLQFLPWRAFGFGELAKGNLPLWNPHVFGGAPYFAGFQSALLYPPNWLHLILPLNVAINWIIALHVFLAGYFTYLWCRHRELHIAASILAGVMFMFSGPYFLHIYAGHLPHLALMPWVPLLLLSVDGCFDQPRRYTWWLLGAFTMAMILLAGHPQYVYYTGLATAVYVILNLVFPPTRQVATEVVHHEAQLDPIRLRGYALAGCAVIVVGGILLAAVQLFAGMQAAGESVRAGGVTYEFAASFSFPPENFLTLIAPHLFGTLPAKPDDPIPFNYWGRCYLWEMSLFVSVTGLILAVYGEIAARHAAKRFSFWMAAITATLALGAHTGYLHKLLYYYLPKFGEFRGASKFTFLTALFLCMLAACGMDSLIRARRAPRGLLIGVAAAFVLLATIGVGSFVSAHASGKSGWFAVPVRDYLEAQADRITDHRDVYFAPREFARMGGADFFRDAARVIGTSILTAAGATLLMLALLLLMRVRAAFAYGLVAIAAVEMFLFARPTRMTTSSNVTVPTEWQAALRTVAPDQRVLPVDPTYENLGMWRGYSSAWGYDPGVLRRYAEVMLVSQGKDPDQASQYLTFNQAAPGIFAMERIALVLQTPPTSPATVPMPAAMPVAALVPSAMVIHDRHETFGLLSQSLFDPRNLVVLNQEPSVKPAGRSATGAASVSNQTTDSMEIDAQVESASILLITNNYSTGWRLVPLLPAPPGQPGYELVPANWCQMAVALAPGKHRFRLEYSPLAFRIGAWVSALSLAGFLAASGLMIARHRRRRRA